MLIRQLILYEHAMQVEQFQAEYRHCKTHVALGREDLRKEPSGKK